MLIYGGSFNPPHLGHVDALRCAVDALRPDRALVIPAGMPPHKELAQGSPGPADRLTLCRLAFSAVEGAEVSDLELRRDGKSYTVETLRTLRKEYPEADFIFLVGTDMLLSLEKWYEFREIFSLCDLAALPRNEGDLPAMRQMEKHLLDTYGEKISLIEKAPLPMDSTSLRSDLPLRGGRDRLSEGVYEEIIRRRYYFAKPDLAWLREKAYAYLKPRRIPHVKGCEETAVALARRWGEDEGEAAEAAILHDITKKLSYAEQLQLCGKYSIELDEAERADEKLLHARTGACFARDLFGVSDAVFSAIDCHTTGKPGMTTLDKIIYLADYTEPNRSFPGLERVRELCTEDLDLAMIEALQLSEKEIRSRGAAPHPRGAETLKWLRKKES